MITFLEYLNLNPRQRIKPSQEEVRLLYHCRDKLEVSPYGRGLVDKGGRILNPYLWIPLPEDIGGGLRIYTTHGGIAVRLQPTPEGLPVGKAYRVEVSPTEKGSPPATPEGGKKPDPTVFPNLMGYINRLISEIRKAKKDHQARSMVPNVDPIPFRPFWPDPPEPSPIY